MEPKISVEFVTGAGSNPALTITTSDLKIRGGFYADSAMYKHSAIANTTAQGPVRSQNTKGGFSFPSSRYLAPKTPARLI